ncbi:Hypothetical predicted protein [Pelobates cultripes]|uniref:Uncharacterized protein n=1 Tax=Pelobates cultripes TaxID=61616 RepID=A0AAD1W2C2_PELCU|nr:Hypothetical predicted protein [Pelobates cultripes]
MANQKHEKHTEKSKRSSFFSAKTSTSKSSGLAEIEQDGGGVDDTLPLQASPRSLHLLVTQDILQSCLEAMSNKILANIQGFLRELRKDVQELGD